MIQIELRYSCDGLVQSKKYLTTELISSYTSAEPMQSTGRGIAGVPKSIELMWCTVSADQSCDPCDGFFPAQYDGKITHTCSNKSPLASSDFFGDSLEHAVSNSTTRDCTVFLRSLRS